MPILLQDGSDHKVAYCYTRDSFRCHICRRAVNLTPLYDTFFCRRCIKKHLLGRPYAAIEATIAADTRHDPELDQLIDPHTLWTAQGGRQYDQQLR